MFKRKRVTIAAVALVFAFAVVCCIRDSAHIRQTFSAEPFTVILDAGHGAWA